MSATGVLIPIGYQVFTNPNTNAPVAGGSLYSYQSGTTTPQATYTDATLGTANANPLVLDSNGGATAFVNPTVGYKYILKDSSGNTLWTRDQIYAGVPPNSIGSQQIANGAVTPTQLDLSTLTSSNLPTGLIATGNIQNGAVTGEKIASQTIEVGNLDPNLDLTQLGKICEVVFSGNGILGESGIIATPQYPWAAPSLLSNPSTLPAGSSGQPRWTRDGKFLAIPHATSPFITIYQRAGSKLTKLPDPATLPAGQGGDCSWSPDGQFLAIAHDSAPYVTVYRRMGVSFDTIASPSLAANVTGVEWSADGRYLSVANGSGLTVFTFSRKKLISENSGNNICWLVTTSAQSGKLFPGMITSGETLATASFPNANQIIVESLDGSTPSGTIAFDSFGSITGSITVSSAQIISTWVEYYFWDSGVNVAPPGTTCNRPRWTPDSTNISVAITQSPFFEVYGWDGSILTAITSPSTLPAAATTATAWSPDGQFLAIGGTSGNYIYLYQFNGSTLTALTAPSTLPTGTVEGLSWSPNGKYLAVAMEASPYILIYYFDGTTFTKLADPVDHPTGNGIGVSWHPSSKFLTVTSDTTPYIFSYQTTGTIQSNSLLYVGNLIDV